MVKLQTAYCAKHASNRAIVSAFIMPSGRGAPRVKVVMVCGHEDIVMMSEGNYALALAQCRQVIELRRRSA